MQLINGKSFDIIILQKLYCVGKTLFTQIEFLCSQVKHVFDESPFYVPSNSVTLMNGTNEGINA